MIRISNVKLFFKSLPFFLFALISASLLVCLHLLTKIMPSFSNSATCWDNLYANRQWWEINVVLHLRGSCRRLCCTYIYTELEALVAGSLLYRSDRRLWQCTRCGKESLDKARIRRHAEASVFSTRPCSFWRKRTWCALFYIMQCTA